MEQFIAKNGEWILANINCTGYYRVNYNPENWQRLLTQLETDPDVSKLGHIAELHTNQRGKKAFEIQ